MDKAALLKKLGDKRSKWEIEKFIVVAVKDKGKKDDDDLPIEKRLNVELDQAQLASLLGHDSATDKAEAKQLRKSKAALERLKGGKA